MIDRRAMYDERGYGLVTMTGLPLRGRAALNMVPQASDMLHLFLHKKVIIIHTLQTGHCKEKDKQKPSLMQKS